MSWLCVAFTVLGLWFNGRKVLLGPSFGIAGFIPWAILSIQLEQPALLVLNIVLLVLQVRNFILWRNSGSRWL